MDKPTNKPVHPHNKLVNSLKHRKLVKDSIELFRVYNNGKSHKNKLGNVEISQIAQNLAMPMENETRRNRE